VDTPAAPAPDAFRRELLATPTALEQRILQRIDERTAQTRRDVDEQNAETRRHFDVVAENMMVKIELVAEGIRGNNERLDRFRGEVRAEFARVDHRLLRLEAGRPRKRRR
jgi:hypothetical protein